MAEIQAADPKALRRAIAIVLVIVAAGAILIDGFEHYREPLREWIRYGPGARADRVRNILLLSMGVLTLPLAAFVIYLWRLGARVVQARRYPPPGFPVIRDTPVVRESSAVARGRVLKILAAGLGIALVLMWTLLWRLAVAIQ